MTPSRKIPLDVLPAHPAAAQDRNAAPPDPPSQTTQDSPLQTTIRQKVIEVLKKIYDPEIPINIYELGLIYAIEVTPSGGVLVRMTLTAPACPVAESLPPEVEAKIQAIPEVTCATVDLVWDPPWDRDRMSEAARLALGLM